MKVTLQEQILQKTAKILAGKNVKVTMEGFAPRVEYNSVTKMPERVVLPVLPEKAEPVLINAIQGYIDHECGHILHSDGDDICNPTKNKLWHYIHNCIDDPRINAIMSDQYLGVEVNIRNGYNFIFDRKDPVTGECAYTKEYVDNLDLSSDDKLKDAQFNFSSFWFARQTKCRFNTKKYDEMDVDRLYKDLEPKMDLDMLTKLRNVKTTKDVVELTDYFVEFFHKEFSEDPSSGGSGTGKGKPKPGEGKDDSKGRLANPESTEDKLAKAIEEILREKNLERKKNWWWTDRWDKKFTKHDMAKGGVDIRAFEEETKQVTNYLIKDLRRILEERRRRFYTGGFKSGKLNAKALFSIRLGNDRVFKKKSEARDVNAAVGLLIDLSGSMNQKDGDDATKVYVACQAAYAFALCLEQLKIPYEIYGFTTDNSTPEMHFAWLEFSKKLSTTEQRTVVNQSTGELSFAFKEYGENFDLISKMAIVKASKALIGMKQNEDSKHVHNALVRLSLRPEAKKTLFIFSDGQPYLPPTDRRASCEMLKYLGHSSQAEYGVDIFALGIHTDAVKDFYTNYKMITKLSELPTALFGFLKNRI